MKKILLVTFLVLITTFNLCLAKEMKKVYLFKNTPESELLPAIKTHISDKQHRVVDTNSDNSFYYLKPRYMGVINENDYLILNLKQIGSDTYLFAKNNYCSEQKLLILMRYLKKNGFKYVIETNKEIVASLGQESSQYLEKINEKVTKIATVCKSNVPQWAEFCPAPYIDAQYVATETGPDVQKNFPITRRQQFLDRSILFRPFVVHDLRKRVQAQRISNYWVQRRMAFDNEIRTCSADPKNQSMCFMQVRQLENARNVQLENQRIAEIQIMQQDQNNALNFFNFLQMQQVNSNLYGINGNLNMIQSQMNLMNSLNRRY